MVRKRLGGMQANATECEWRRDRGRGVAIKTWATRQATVALSSGEAEFYAAGKAAAEALAAQSLMADLGWRLRPHLFVDASAAQGMATRQGIGRVRHLDVRFLWLQQTVKSGVLRLSKVWGT